MKLLCGIFLFSISLETVNGFKFRRVFGLFWLLLAPNCWGSYAEADITPNSLVQNQLKRTEKSTEIKSVNSLLVWGDLLSEFSGMSAAENQELKDYIAHFPHARYGIYDIPGVGSFFVDPVRDFIKDRLRQGIPWETHIIALLKQHIRQGSVVIDLGAHVGTHTVTMSQCVGPMGRVFAFEPQKKLFRELLMNLQLNHIKNVTAFRYALGNEEKQVQMGLSPPGNEGGTAIGSGGDIVWMKRLDSFSFHNVSLIKIDVEGYEDEVLLGSKETIMREKPVIVIEIMGGHVYEHASAEVRAKIEKTISLLESFGYSVLRLEGHDYCGLPL